MSKAGPTKGEAGYTYAALLVLIFALALGATATTIPPSTTFQRNAEAELIHRGQSYARAIESYWRADPDNPEFPPTLEALLDDPRENGRRHIRRLLDPVIASEWRVIWADTGGVLGVSPASEKPSFRRSSFPEQMRVEDGAVTYAQWTFVFDPETQE